ncbi:MAG TPA: V-type ATP synthase subunit F [Steroidobacteraceae bacterium]|nr:V-type ATP synthase subunit F [Steroidobacteraceae bacterium]
MRLAVIADEATSIGWRLAGAQVHTPGPGSQPPREHFHAALAQADLVLVTASLAARLPRAELAEALHALEPLVLIIPDLRHEQEPPDIAAQMRRALGVTP